MHAPNLLKIVLKPRTMASGLDKAGKRSGESASCEKQVTRSSTDSVLAARPASAKMACLCAPTKHAGSFRCRLHRAGQTQWASHGSSSRATVPNPERETVRATAPNPERAMQAISAPVSILDLERPNRGDKKRAPAAFRSASISPPSSPEKRPSRFSRVGVADSLDESAVRGHRMLSVSSTVETSGVGGFSRYLSRNGAPSTGLSETLVR